MRSWWSPRVERPGTRGSTLIIDLAHELVHMRGREHLRFLFCGDGPRLESFKELARTHKLGHHFTFAGRRNDVRAILPSCDIGIQASKGRSGTRCRSWST